MIKDHVVCTWCGTESYIDCGGQTCPECGKEGMLDWWDFDEPEVEVGDTEW